MKGYLTLEEIESPMLTVPVGIPEYLQAARADGPLPPDNTTAHAKDVWQDTYANKSPHDEDPETEGKPRRHWFKAAGRPFNKLPPEQFTAKWGLLPKPKAKGRKTLQPVAYNAGAQALRNVIKGNDPQRQLPSGTSKTSKVSGAKPSRELSMFRTLCIREELATSSHISSAPTPAGIRLNQAYYDQLDPAESRRVAKAREERLKR